MSTLTAGWLCHRDYARRLPALHSHLATCRHLVSPLRLGNAQSPSVPVHVGMFPAA